MIWAESVLQQLQGECSVTRCLLCTSFHNNIRRIHYKHYKTDTVKPAFGTP